MKIDDLRGKNYGVEHLLASFSGPLDEIVEKTLELPEEKVRFLRSFGSIYVNNQRCLKNAQIEEGTYLRVHQNPRRFPVQVFQWPEQKVFENSDFVVVNKPSGLPVPATVDNIQENMSSLISQALNHQVHVTHRLDVATNGLVVFAKSKNAQTEFNKKLAAGEVRKLYRALVHGVDLPTGDWLHYMEPSPRAPKVVSSAQMPGWSPCRLRVLDQTEIFPGHSEVIIELITGRTHQIRAQLSASGFPIVGDVAYGSPVKLANFEMICLQAFYLEFQFQSEKNSFRLSDSPWQKLPPQKFTH